MNIDLPEEISKHLASGYEVKPGIWLVLPATRQGQREGIQEVNVWIKAEDWYPEALREVVWFGDDGTGNFFGWDATQDKAILWNPEDGEEPWKVGSVNYLWQFVLNGYRDAT
jgi:hypothetical protein